MGIAEAEPDVFYISTLLESTVERVDLRGWTPGFPVQRVRALSFPAAAKRLNGACLLSPNVLAIADGAREAVGTPDILARGFEAADYFCVDEREEFAYVATHITNTIDACP